MNNRSYADYYNEYLLKYPPAGALSFKRGGFWVLFIIFFLCGIILGILWLIIGACYGASYNRKAREWAQECVEGENNERND